MANRKSELETLKADLEARLSRYQAHQRREAGALENCSSCSLCGGCQSAAQSTQTVVYGNT